MWRVFLSFLGLVVLNYATYTKSILLNYFWNIPALQCPCLWFRWILECRFRGGVFRLFHRFDAYQEFLLLSHCIPQFLHFSPKSFNGSIATVGVDSLGVVLVMTAFKRVNGFVEMVVDIDDGVRLSAVTVQVSRFWQ